MPRPDVYVFVSWLSNGRCRSQSKVDFLGQIIVEEERLEEVEEEFACFRSEPVDLEEETDVLEDVHARENLWLRLNLLSQVAD